MKTKYIALSILSISMISSVAYAFTRNLSGVWKTPGGNTIVIGHDVSASKAIFSRNMQTKTFKATLEYRGDVTGADGSTRFAFAGVAEDVAIPAGDAVCTLSNIILMTEGQVIGQFPNRKLNMEQCVTAATLQCKRNGKVVKEDIIGSDCSGVWE